MCLEKSNQMRTGRNCSKTLGFDSHINASKVVAGANSRLGLINRQDMGGRRWPSGLERWL